jgi:16S rRNA (guanine966-N2)-methyltransferase
MKERVREAIFNLLGPRIRDKHAVDLFGGTGALGFEALSRGASRTTIIERHFPTARLIRQNAASLELNDRVTVLEGDAFFYGRELPLDDGSPWAVFFSPPYDYYVEQTERLMELIGYVVASTPPTSLVIVESDERFDVGSLPEPDTWDVRLYRPAQIAIAQLPSRAADE